MLQASRVIVFYSIDTLMDEVVYLVITVTVPIKQYNYILNEKKVKHWHFTIIPISIPILKIIVGRTAKRNCVRSSDGTTEGRNGNFGHTLQEGANIFFYI